MKKSRIWFLAVILTTKIATAEQAAPLELRPLVLQTIEKNYEIQVAQLQKQLGALDVKSKTALYDTITQAVVNHTIDRRKNPISVFGDENDTTNFNLGIRRTFSSGTQLGLDWNNQRFDTNSPFVTTNPTFTAELKASLTQPLLQNFFGRNGRLLIDSAKVQEEVLNLQIEDQIETIIAQLLNTYWQLAYQQKNLEYAQEALKWAANLRDNNQRKYKLGLIDKSDYLAAAANYGVRQQGLLAAQADLEVGSVALSQIAKLPQSTQYRCARMPAEEQTRFERTAVEKQALENRRDLQALHKELKANDLVIAINKNQQLPNLDLVSSLSLNGLDDDFNASQSDVSSGDNLTFFIGGVLTYNWDKRAERADLQRNRLIKRQKLLRLKENEEQILADIQQALVAHDAQEAQLAQSAEVVRLQREKLKEEEIRVAQGKSDTTNVVRNQEDLLQAQQTQLFVALTYQRTSDALWRLQNTLLKRYQ